MNELGKHLASGIKIHYQTTVQSVEKIDSGWVLCSKVDSQDANDSVLRSDAKDCLVLAVPGPQAASMIDSACNWKQAAGQRPMQPTWAAMVEFEKIWEIPWDAIRFEDHPCLDWISRETSKPNRSRSNHSSSLPEVWIIHANHRWSAQNIDRTPQDAAEQLLQALVELGLDKIPGTIGLQGHRWRYAQAGSEPAEARLEPHVLWDPESMIGACGDWVCDQPTVGRDDSQALHEQVWASKCKGKRKASISAKAFWGRSVLTVGLDVFPLFSLFPLVMREGSLGLARYPLRHIGLEA
jgi:predicted NAD/FAD-dependent oxidoreductase